MSSPYELMMQTFDYVRRRRTAYQLACNQPATQEMLIDLAKFCRAHESCVFKDDNGRVDQRMTLILEGRREVWTRIMDHCHLTASQLYALYTGKQFNPGEYDERGN